MSKQNSTTRKDKSQSSDQPTKAEEVTEVEEVKDVPVQKEEKKPDPVEEKPETDKDRTLQSVAVMSNLDSSIYDRMKSQPKSLDELDSRVEVVEDEDNKRHRLSLPEELEKFQEKYAFRWLFKNKQALDYACDVRGWVICNKTYFPDIPKHLFTVHGSIERGDSVLSFMPKAKAEKIRKEPGEKSDQIIKSQFDKHQNDPRYYKPKEASEGGGRENVVMI